MREAAEALRLTAQDLEKLGVADLVIEEPLGGAQRDRATTIMNVGEALEKMLVELEELDPDQLVVTRRQKFLDVGSKGLAA
jgi:acetyl-CoA carboxylase carboxyl transferase subunit alpha